MLALHVLLLAAALVQKGLGAGCYIQASASDTPLCSTCGGGDCTAENGCACKNDETITCVPTNECSSIGTNICCPTDYYWSATDNCCTGTLTCNPACNSDEMCTNVSSVATCSCNSTVFSGLNVSSLVPTLQCGSTVIEVSLSKCLLQSLGYDSTSFHLNNNSGPCINTYTNTVNGQTMETIQVLPQTGWCGNDVTTDSSKVYYSNVLHIGIQNTIITANPLNLNISCSYNLTIQTSLLSALNVSTSMVNLTASGEGSVVTTMAAYWDSAYTRPIQSTDTVPIGSNIYLGIVADAGDVSIFVLRTESCIATPDNNMNNVNKVAIVSGGCPANQGVNAEVQENGVSFESRIEFNSFAFQGQPLVYITCTVRLCDKNTTCTGCSTARVADSSVGVLQIPINLEDYYDSSASSTAVSWALLTSSLLALLFMKFF